jgi:hypothetical protein
MNNQITVLSNNLIPEIMFVLEKDGHIEVLKTWENVEDWVLEILEKEVHNLWLDVSRDCPKMERFDSPAQMVNEMFTSDIEDFINENGWNLTRKAIFKE